jgi:hypothetical protein
VRRHFSDDRHGGSAGGVPRARGAFSGKNGRIAFASDREGGDADIWTMNPNGNDPVNLTAESEATDALPNWRADGRRIVLASDRETPRNPTPTGLDGPDFELFVMNGDGSNQTRSRSTSSTTSSSHSTTDSTALRTGRPTAGGSPSTANGMAIPRSTRCARTAVTRRG